MDKINIKKPDISPDFTVQDIRKIREYNYERRKNMTIEEAIADTQRGANKALERINELRAKKSISKQ